MAQVITVVSVTAALITIGYFCYELMSKSSLLRRVVRIFLGMEKFRKRARENAKEKRLIGRYLAQRLLTDYGKPNATFFLENGTTAAEVGLSLLSRDGVNIVTNNLLIGLAFAGNERGAHCHLLPGALDEDYPGIVGEETVRALPIVLDQCQAAVMNATTFDIDSGPCVRSQGNQAVKRCILEHGRTIFLCFDSRKVVRRLTQPDDRAAPAIYQPEEWRRILREKDIHLVIGTPSRWFRVRKILFEEKWYDLLAALQRAKLPHEIVTTGAARVRHLHIPPMAPGRDDGTPSGVAGT